MLPVDLSGDLDFAERYQETAIPGATLHELARGCSVGKKHDFAAHGLTRGTVDVGLIPYCSSAIAKFPSGFCQALH